MKDEIKRLIDFAQENIEVCERNHLNEWTKPYMIAAVAESILAITRMFATDYEQSFPEEHDES